MPTILQVTPDESFQIISQKIISGLPLEHLKDKRVLIKPNWVNHLSPATGVTVDPAFIKELVIQLKLLGAAQVSIGEASIIDTDRVFSKLDVKKIIDGKAAIIDLSKEKDWLSIPLHPSTIELLRIPKRILEFDTLISVAKLKTHCQTRVSFTAKNLFGLLSKSSRMAAHKIDLDSSIAGIYLYLRKKINILGLLDGTVALDGPHGPLKGNAVALNLIVFGENAKDVDNAGCLIIGCSPNTVGHLVAIEKNTEKKFDKSLVKGYTGAYPLRQFDLPPVGGWRGPLNLSPVINFLFKKKPWWRDREKCTLCRECIKICPLNCISNINDEIVINKDICVECLCCSEVCSEAAMTYKVRLGWLHSAMKKTLRTINILRDS